MPHGHAHPRSVEPRCRAAAHSFELQFQVAAHGREERDGKRLQLFALPDVDAAGDRAQAERSIDFISLLYDLQLPCHDGELVSFGATSFALPRICTGPLTCVTEMASNSRRFAFYSALKSPTTVCRDRNPLVETR